MLIGIIGAMKIEVAELIKSMDHDNIESIGKIAFHCGRINNNNVIIAECGIGKDHATKCTQTMILKYSPDIIINTGIAGSIAPSIKVGDLVIASSVVDYDAADNYVNETPLRMVSGVNHEFHCDESVVNKLIQSVEDKGDNQYQVGLIVTSDKFICKKEDLQSIIDKFHAIACDMESGSIGRVCSCSKIPFGIIRLISNNAVDCKVSSLDLNAIKKTANIVKIFLGKVNLSPIYANSI